MDADQPSYGPEDGVLLMQPSEILSTEHITRSLPTPLSRVAKPQTQTLCSQDQVSQELQNRAAASGARVPDRNNHFKPRESIFKVCRVCSCHGGDAL